MSDTPFPHTDAELTQRTGWPLRVIAEKRRELTVDVDWALVGGTHGRRRAQWSEAAATRLMAEAQGPAPAPLPNAEKAASEAPSDAAEPAPVAEPEKTAAALPAGAVVVTVAKGPVVNRALLLCYGPGGSAHDPATWLRVRVKTSENFLPGMTVLAERIEGDAGWRYLGRPDAPAHARVVYPRGRGKW